jgi:hypothetical protein
MGLDVRGDVASDFKAPYHRSPSDPELASSQQTQPSTAELIDIETSNTEKENWNPFSPFYVGKDTDFTVNPGACDDDMDFASLRENLPSKDTREGNQPHDGAVVAPGNQPLTTELFSSQILDPLQKENHHEVTPKRHDSDESPLLSPGEFPNDFATNPFLYDLSTRRNEDLNASDSSETASPEHMQYNTLTPPLSPGDSDPFGAVPFNVQQQKKQISPTSPDVFGAAPFEVSPIKKEIQAENPSVKGQDLSDGLGFSHFGSDFVEQGPELNIDDQGRDSPKNPFEVEAFGESPFAPRNTELVSLSIDTKEDLLISHGAGFDNPVLDRVDAPHDPFGSAPFNSNINSGSQNAKRDTNVDPRPPQNPRTEKPRDRPRRRLPQTPTKSDSGQGSMDGNIAMMRQDRRKAEQKIVLSRPTHSNR